MYVCTKYHLPFLLFFTIHLPNDDWLFPGRMDTQIGGDLEADDEWAVDRIILHAGSGTDAVFEIKWKSGDITWLPYYQITHLNALTKYMDLLGISKISTLPQGKGSPPPDDPQVFIGSLSPFLTNSTSFLFDSIKSHFVSLVRLATS